MYINKYDKDRRGCMKFLADGDEYVYTKFEPYGAHKVFPCFDQPDIKASMKISVVTPADWIVVSNEPSVSAESFHVHKYRTYLELEHSSSIKMLDKFTNHQRIGNNTKMTLFGRSKVISTYLFVFAAGPYTCIDAPYNSGSVPMRIYSARSS